MTEPSRPEGEGDAYHRPVMADEVAELFSPLREGIVVDATFGGGGHTRRLKETLGGRVRYVAIDRDPEAAREARGLDVTFLAGDLGDIADLLDGAGITRIVGVLFDFGISSRQVDDPARGFSYRRQGPLDMRMNPEAGPTAADLVNTLPEVEIARLLRRLGEEPHAARIARAIVARRPFSTTTELADLVAEAVPAAARRAGHPARKTFQALRIAVNNELESVARGLDGAIARLDPGGRCVAISYHSLEDRIVKRRFVAGSRGCTCPPDLPVCGCDAAVELRVLTRHPMRPTDPEVAANPRARSARLRAAEKVAA